MNTQSIGASTPAVFQFNATFQVRVVVINNEPWFCLRDVCKILDLDRTSNLIISLDKEGVVKNHTLTNSGTQQFNFISEPNLYRVIFRSNKPEAKTFQDWVFNEVLPAIRKTGKYEPDKTVQPEPITPDYINTNDDKTIRSIIYSISRSMRYEQAWLQGSWFAIRKSTGTQSPQALETKHLPIIAEELTRILGIATKLNTFVTKIEKEVIKTALRESADIDDIIAKNELEVATFLKEIGDEIKLNSWDKKQVDFLLSK
ncbi:MAG: Bro-N domain-containing protein [Methylococcales bacterium]